MAISQSKSISDMPGADKNSVESELEQYGIWVKAEPQDIVEEPETALMDAPAPPDDAGNAFLTEEEENLLGSLDSTPELEIQDAASLEIPEFDLDTVQEPQAELSKSSGDFDLTIEDVDFDAAPLQSDDSSITPPSLPEFSESDASVIDLPLDDLEEHVPSPVPEVSSAPAPVAAKSASTLETEEFSLADFGIEEETSPQKSEPVATTPETETMDLADFGIENDSDKPKEETSEEEFEPIDIDLQFDDTLPEPVSMSAVDEGPSIDIATDASGTAFESVSDFDDFLNGDEAASTATDSAPAASPTEEASSPVQEISADFNTDIASIPDQIDDASMELIEESDANAEALPVLQLDRATRQSSTISQDILVKIVDELSSIKNELVSLKSELAGFKSGEQSTTGTVKVDQATSEVPGGFFDEEEDETIALTGDELDNILNTANFTEESADVVAETAPTEVTQEIGEDLLPESGEYDLTPLEDDQGIEEIVLDGESAVVDNLIVKSDAAIHPEIAAMAEAGVMPITEAPEDTAFLDAEGNPEFPIGITDEAPLVEPDLSDIDLEDVTGADVTEELPSAESIRPLEDLTLDIEHTATVDVVDQDVSEAIPEIEFEMPPNPQFPPMGEQSAEVAEELLELDVEDQDTELSEIVLHEESLHEASETSEPEPESLDSIDETIIKPAQPVVLHPDDIAMELSDEFFVGPGDAASDVEQVARDLQTPSPNSQDTAEAELPEAVRKEMPDRLKTEIRSVLSYLDKLLESLPEEKIEEFAKSEYFETYKKLFEELGLV